ncbi:hypothetical protein GVO57_03785 [Sphingomonas changnyeongensis]|uniref:Right handed beta helix domain-containing protein n=1 Tax=Sphingomonas changnyeongensis TaxID=2698679 RepID=A0A7Z2NUL1_9SPHN|nr:right-handed parallel beta-helix repeat-containing protein [Sphingomonas changnyeongensis]QHL90113.1 hypothetical protein GVO57_03785 [Sphingomonas changnyeongensis]
MGFEGRIVAAGMLALAAMAGLAGAGAASAGAPAAGARVIDIADRAALVAALAAARGGETLRLAPGAYGQIAIAGRVFPAAVTLQSRDAARPARLNGVAVSASANLVFRQLDIGRALAPGEPDFTQLSTVTDSRAVRFDRIFFHGSRDGTPANDAWGLYVVGSSGIEIAGSRFEELMRAYIFDRSSDIAVIGNSFRLIRSDAGDFAAVDRVVVRGNSYRDFMPRADDHPDAIQFWTNGQQRGSSDILIEDNVIMQGDGVGPQGIFIRDEQKRYPYRNLVIRNNLIYTEDQWEGISVEGAADVEVSGNSVLSPLDRQKQAWIRLENVGRATVTGNVTVRYVGPAAGGPHVVRDNSVLIEDRALVRRLGGLKPGARPEAERLLIPGRGYRPPAPAAEPAAGRAMGGAECRSRPGCKAGSCRRSRCCRRSCRCARRRAGRRRAARSSSPA